MHELVIELQGEIDVQVSPQVRDSVMAAVEQADGRPVLVDLAQVTFLDSSGLTALIAGLRAARERSGQLRLVHVPATVRPIFDITHTAERFGLGADEQRRPARRPEPVSPRIETCPEPGSRARGGI